MEEHSNDPGHCGSAFIRVASSEVHAMARSPSCVWMAWPQQLMERMLKKKIPMKVQVIYAMAKEQPGAANCLMAMMRMVSAMP